MRLSLLALGAVITSALASPTGNYVIHEKRTGLPSKWSKREQVDRGAVLPLRIALSQRNIDRGYEFLEDVSHPDSPNYGKHWTPKKVAETFSAR